MLLHRSFCYCVSVSVNLCACVCGMCVFMYMYAGVCNSHGTGVHEITGVYLHTFSCEDERYLGKPAN